MAQVTCPNCGNADADDMDGACSQCGESLFDDVSGVFDNGLIHVNKDPSSSSGRGTSPRERAAYLSSTCRTCGSETDGDGCEWCHRYLGGQSPRGRASAPDDGEPGPGYWARALEHADQMVERASETLFAWHNSAAQFRAQVPEFGPAGDTTDPDVRERFLTWQEALHQAGLAEQQLEAAQTRRAQLQRRADEDFDFWSLAGPGPAQPAGDDDSLAEWERRAERAHKNRRRAFGE
jgi:hypothetical protein